MCWTTWKSFPSWEIFIVKKRRKSSRKEIKRWTTVVDDFSESEEATTRQTSSSEAIQFYNHKANIWFPFLSIQSDSSLHLGSSWNQTQIMSGEELNSRLRQKDSYWDFTTQHKQYRMYLRVAQEKNYTWSPYSLVLPFLVFASSSFDSVRLLTVFRFFGCMFMFSIHCCSSVSSTMYV